MSAFVSAGLGGGFALADNVRGAAIADGRWLLVVVGLVLAATGRVIRSGRSPSGGSPPAAHICSLVCG